MSWNGKDGTAGDLVERGFTLTVDDRTVPGVYWAPSEGEAERLVLLGHGGTTHKRVEYIVEVAKALAGSGFACMAIDGPSHGDRPGAEAYASAVEGNLDTFAERWSGGGGTAAVVADWGAALDFVESEAGARPTGWWGLSMGTMMGLPVTAADPRVSVAVLGLMGTWGPNAEDLATLAPDVTCPVRFLVQWDDEIVPRDACLDLFGALGTRKKTLHANPGAHADVPMFEVLGTVDYLDRFVG